MSKPKIITAVVFDCFGVIFADAFKALLAECEPKLPRPLAYYYRLDLLNGDGIVNDTDYYAELARDTGLSPAALRTRFHNKQCRLEGTAQIIRELRQKGYHIGLLSNIDRTFLDEFLAYEDTGALFDVTLASSEAGANKPERKIFEVMAQQLQTPFEQWFFTDDSPGNVVAAQSYGITSHVFTSPMQLRQALTNEHIL